MAPLTKTYLCFLLFAIVFATCVAHQTKMLLLVPVAVLIVYTHDEVYRASLNIRSYRVGYTVAVANAVISFALIVAMNIVGWQLLLH